MKKCSNKFEPRFELTNPWMINLTNRLVSEISLPGTHDSCCNLDCGILQCQAWSLEEQLVNGVRFLDIRCRHYENSLAIHHDWVYCNLSFSDVLKICRNFLEINPSECLVMRLKQEYTETKCSRKFEETFIEYYENNKDILYLSHRIPLLNDIRGKIWVIFDFECNSLVSYKWSSAKIQDMWAIETSDEMKLKIKKIYLHYLEALNGSSNNLFINFFSGTGKSWWPKNISQITNQCVVNHKGKLGVVIFDFPDVKSLNHVISQNCFLALPLKKIKNVFKKVYFRRELQKKKRICLFCSQNFLKQIPLRIC